MGEAGGFNLYSYCGNDPVNRHDPLGLQEVMGFAEPLNPDEAMFMGKLVLGAAKGFFVEGPKDLGKGLLHEVNPVNKILDPYKDMKQDYQEIAAAWAHPDGFLVGLEYQNKQRNAAYKREFERFMSRPESGGKIIFGVATFALGGLLGAEAEVAAAARQPALSPLRILPEASDILVVPDANGTLVAASEMQPHSLSASRQLLALPAPPNVLALPAPPTILALPFSLPEFTFRGDDRAPSTIFEDGFSARGISTDVFLHVLDNRNPPSGFIATSKSFSRAFHIDPRVYVVRPRNGIDVNAVIGTTNPYPWEVEVVIPWRIEPSDIRAITLPSGVSILNPNWRP